MSRAFVASPVRHPIIGWMADLKALTPDDARGWYDQWYAPQQCHRGGCGAMLMQRQFWPRWNASTRTGPQVASDAVGAVEPQQLGAREAQVSAPAENAFFFKAWRAPTLGPADGPVSPDNPVARDSWRSGLGDPARPP